MQRDNQFTRLTVKCEKAGINSNRTMLFKAEMGLAEGSRWEGYNREGFMEEAVSGLGLLSDLTGERIS